MGREGGYYSLRTGQHPEGPKLTLERFKKMVLSSYKLLKSRGFFDEAFGSLCVDAGYTPGTLGEAIDEILTITLRKDDLWPFDERIETYSEHDLFDMLEFFFDHVSKPVDGSMHSYGGCGMHWYTFNGSEGQAEFRTMLNPVLAAYADGFVMSEKGEILQLPEPGMAPLMGATLPKYRPDKVEDKVEAAKVRFRRHNSSLEDRKVALRDLADVLEFLRPQVKEVLTQKDEADLFNLANNFGIRHHNEKQKTNYDVAIWYSWMFYYYLSTIHAVLHLLRKAGKMPEPLKS